MKIILKLIVLLSFLIFVISGCFKQVGEKFADKLIENADPGRNPNRPLKKPATEVTDPDEQYNMAVAYARKGLYQYAKEAIYLYTKAAEQGHVGAQAGLGKFYYKDAASTLGRYKKDLNLAVQWYTKAADQGHIQSMMSLGEIFQNGGTGLLKDPEQSKAYYSKGIAAYKTNANNKDVDSQYKLGLIYKAGKATKRDLTEAARWYEKAALNGHTKAQIAIGDAYLFGSGIAKDPIKGHAWFEVARYYGANYTSVVRLKEESVSNAVAISKELIQKIEANKNPL